MRYPFSWGPTIFPSVFAAIMARFLRGFAAIKLEHGTTVSTLEFLLQSRTVFSTITGLFVLRQLCIAALFLILLWSLSPLGGQASLRVVYKGHLVEDSEHDFTYFAYFSESFTGGDDGPGVERRIAINSAFTALLVSPASVKDASQDLYGNIKIPLLESVPHSESMDTWRYIPQDQNVSWSSMAGLPVDRLPIYGLSRFIINTGFMVAGCEVTGISCPSKVSINNSTGNGTALCGNIATARACKESSGNFAVLKLRTMSECAALSIRQCP